jgi:hypothetical protein
MNFITSLQPETVPSTSIPLQKKTIKRLKDELQQLELLEQVYKDIFWITKFCFKNFGSSNMHSSDI